MTGFGDITLDLMTCDNLFRSDQPDKSVADADDDGSRIPRSALLLGRKLCAGFPLSNPAGGGFPFPRRCPGKRIRASLISLWRLGQDPDAYSIPAWAKFSARIARRPV
jgi:hypothetical protein